MEWLLQFHGSDWIGMIFGLLSVYYLAEKRRAGFVYGIIAGAGWIAFGFLTHSIPSIIANLLFIACNCRGFRTWNHGDKAPG